jgi:hypothetical protein
MILNLNNRFSIFLIVLFGTNSFFSQKVIRNELNIGNVMVKFETTDSRLEGDFKVFKIIEGKEKLIVQGTMEIITGRVIGKSLTRLTRIKF